MENLELMKFELTVYMSNDDVTRVYTKDMKSALDYIAYFCEKNGDPVLIEIAYIVTENETPHE